MHERTYVREVMGADTGVTADPAGDPVQILLERYGNIIPEEALLDPTSIAAMILKAVHDCEI